MSTSVHVCVCYQDYSYTTDLVLGTYKTWELHMHGCKCFTCIDLNINPWPQNSFTGSSHFLALKTLPTHFPISPLTLRPLHGGQTSQDKCVRVAPAFDAVNDIHGSHGGVAWGVRSGDMPNLPDYSSSNRKREKLSLKCDTWSTSNLGFFWWGRLPTVHQGRFRLSTNLKNLLVARGCCPLRSPAFKRGATPLLITPMAVY